MRSSRLGVPPLPAEGAADFGLTGTLSSGVGTAAEGGGEAGSEVCKTAPVRGAGARGSKATTPNPTAKTTTNVAGIIHQRDRAVGLASAGGSFPRTGAKTSPNPDGIGADGAA